MDFSQLNASMRGPVFTPDTDGYEDVRRAWNRLFDHRPAAVARCIGNADVIAAVNFAREHGILTAVRGGGHSYAGNSSVDDGLVIDLGLMRGLHIDTKTRKMRVEPGVKWDQVFREAQMFGLAVPAGPPQAGVSGVALGGGVGLLSRKWGMTLDNIVSAEVVTAAGELVRASETENSDLFWALRGGTGNFGVVTSLELQLHELGQTVLGGPIIHPWRDAAAALRFFREFMSTAPDEVGVFALVYTVPPLEFFPAEFHGQSALGFSVCYAGDPARGAEVLRPLREWGTPMLDGVREQTYESLKHADDAAIEAWDRVYAKSHNLPELTDEAIDTFVQFAGALPGDVTLVGILPMTGAIARVPADATAFPHRSGAFEFDIWASWSDPSLDEQIIAWGRRFHAAMGSYADGGVYVNILGADEKDRVPQAYGQNFARLRELKRKWDPTNLFRRNHNIPPAEWGA